MHAGRHAAAAGLGVGLGLTAALSAQQQQNVSHADPAAPTSPDDRARYEPPLPPSKARSTAEPTLREDVSLFDNSRHDVSTYIIVVNTTRSIFHKRYRYCTWVLLLSVCTRKRPAYAQKLP